MPHKHKRKQDDESIYDLPPSARAKALPPRSTTIFTESSNKASRKRKKPSHKNDPQDDTPREFARMMRHFQPSKNEPKPDTDVSEKGNRKRKRDGSDSRNNNTKSTKNKTAQQADHAVGKPSSELSKIKILPGERISDFAARVDRALPLSNIAKHSADSNKAGKKDSSFSKIREDRRTKHERRLLRLQSQWREDDAKFREKREEQQEEHDAENEEVNALWSQWEKEAGKGPKAKGKGQQGKKKKKKKDSKKNGIDGEDEEDEVEDSDGDPWAVLKKKKSGKTRSTDPFDVALAPPEKLVKPRELFKVHGVRGAKVNVADVPVASGSLRQREELATERQNIVEQYRRLMANKRA
ncbi:hypothetical protein FQN57_005061 [Myotisia sp. PD_48]|nr:hypothetical protein FQN57_005061 [Myotisia sp. PD_48]